MQSMTRRSFVALGLAAGGMATISACSWEPRNAWPGERLDRFAKAAGLVQMDGQSWRAA